MHIFVYKIKNIVNNKVYIGQSIRPIEQRFKRHINDAINNNLNTHFARAIRKYGQDKFEIEQIDVANSQEELNKKEQYWIRYYDAMRNGYNETDALYKCGGNTYKNKSSKEMKEIRGKIRASKLNDNNPNSSEIKCLNANTGEEIIFRTLRECQEYFSENTHRFITTRVTNKTRGLYKGIWNIAYVDGDYSCIKDVNKKGTVVLVEDLDTNTKRVFESVRLASRECNINRNKIQYHMKDKREFIIDNYKFTVLD